MNPFSRIVSRRVACAALLAALPIIVGVGAQAQTPDLNAIPPYKPEIKVAGGLRIAGSELKGVVAKLVAGFQKFHPDAMVSTNFMTSSEGALGMLYAGASDVAPMGDDAKITDQMPFYNTFRYVPTEISVATGGYDMRGTLFAWAIVVNADNPLTKLSMAQLDRIFGSERTGGWEVGANADNNLLFTAKYARGPETNIRTWGQLGLTGDWADKPIQTYGYVAPGFAVNFQRQVMHWSTKWNPNFKEYVEEKEATTDQNGKAVISERMMEALQHDRYGIAWAALMHVNGTCVTPAGTKCAAYPGLKVLALSKADDGPAIALTADNVKNRTYPLLRDAYIYVNKPPGRPLDPKVREFLRFVLSREGQTIIANDGTYTPLPASYVREQLKKLDP
ncbi:MAG: substrate-binding domain-containing protein [Candidatus Eremiobacteraeota bacterium]|nr:substrate-binding domain-containing protein [Candidatus Eremiobacteraeota bacterium]